MSGSVPLDVMGLASFIKRVAPRVRRTWSGMDYAQRRAFTNRTGIDSAPPRPRADADIAELEALYALPARQPDRPAGDG